MQESMVDVEGQSEGARGQDEKDAQQRRQQQEGQEHVILWGGVCVHAGTGVPLKNEELKATNLGTRGDKASPRQEDADKSHVGVVGGVCVNAVSGKPVKQEELEALNLEEFLPSSHRCPCCGTMIGGAEREQSMCDNQRWSWKGEPMFCCFCANLKGLGSLSHFGCELCKSRRKRYYKRQSLLNSNCINCGKPGSQHVPADPNGRVKFHLLKCVSAK